jgi:putative molybdopterin biosynthesis protein
MPGDIARAIAQEISEGTRSPGSELPSIRGLAAESGLAPGTVARAYGELRRAGVIASRDRARARVPEEGPARARALLCGGEPLRLSGSDDPALDALLRVVGDAVTMVGGRRGSVRGLEALARSQADAAVVHLLHSESGRYNDPFVRELLPGERVELVHLWRREVGLVVAPGNPCGIAGVADLGGLRVAWRAPGSASRLVLERLFHEAGVAAPSDRGEPADSHVGVAAMVAAGAADAGLAVRAAADACGLDFVPLLVEPFELAVREQAADRAAPLIAGLGQPAFAAAVARMNGYDLTDSARARRPG